AFRARGPGVRTSARRSSATRPERPKPPGGGFVSKNRRRPTLPGGCPPSTIGAEGLNGSVRNGKRCFPLAMTTEKRRDQAPVRLENCTQAKKEDKYRQDLAALVPVC